MKREYTIIDAYIKTVSKEIRNRKVKRELKDELLSHIMEIYERNIALGMSDEEAQKDAIAHMGDSEAVAKTFKKLYPISSYDFLQNNTSRFVMGIAWSLFLLVSRAEPLNSIWFLYALSVCYEALWHYRKIDKKFKFAFNTSIFNFVFIIIFNFIYNYFTLDYSFYRFIIIGYTIISSIEYLFIFYGIKELEKKLEISKKDSRSPIISCCMLIVTQILVSAIELTDNELLLYFMGISAFFLSFFPLAMLGDTTEYFEEIEVYTPKSKEEQRKHAFKKIGVWIVAILFIWVTGFISLNRPVKTHEFILQDTSQQNNTEEIREELISLGLSQNIVYDLPDSEIIKYDNVEYVDFYSNDDKDYKTDLIYHAYACFMPANNSQPERVRVLFVFNNFDCFEELNRDGIYFWKNAYGVDVLESSAEKSSNMFFQILCEIGEKTEKIVPFYQNEKMYSDNKLTPVGFEFGLAKNGANHRIYIAQTFVPNDEHITVGLQYYHNDDSVHHNTRHAHYIKEIFNTYAGLNGISNESIEGYFNNPLYIEPEKTEEPILEVPIYLDGSVGFEPTEEIDNIDELIEYYNP